MKPLLWVALLALVSCASTTRQTDKLVRENTGTPKVLLGDIALIEQQRNHCGPATLTMAIHRAGGPASLSEVTQSAFTTEGEGTFQADMLSTARRNRLLTIPITSMKDLLREVSAGRPVIVFQNLGFSWLPQWHYALVVGHDLSGPDVYLHTGNQSFEKTDMRFFERSWKLGKWWGLLVLAPGELSVTANDRAHVQAAAHLEGLGFKREALTSYQAVLGKWPQSLPALIGLANVEYHRKNYAASETHLKRATKFHPLASIAWHNLAFAQAALGKMKEARMSAAKAIESAPLQERPQMESGLKSFL